MNTPTATLKAQDLLVKGGKFGVFGSYMDARGLKLEALSQGAHQSLLEELTCWTKVADKVIVF